MNDEFDMPWLANVWQITNFEDLSFTYEYMASNSN